MAITTGAAHGTWRSVKGDEFASDSSPFHLQRRVARASGLRRRSGASTEALAGRKAGTDQGTAIVRSRPREFQKVPHAKARKGRFERRGREDLATLLSLTPEQFALRQSLP